MSTMAVRDDGSGTTASSSSSSPSWKDGCPFAARYAHRGIVPWSASIGDDFETKFVWYAEKGEGAWQGAYASPSRESTYDERLGSAWQSGGASIASFWV